MEEDELLNVSFKDTAFMQAHGLHEYNVLDYFSQSQFYDTSCINEQIKMQARFNLLEANLLDHTKMVGFEYDLWYFTYQPSYFIIRKHQRYSPQKTELVAIYYIVEGTIYQSPSLSTLLTNRVLTSTFFLTKAFEVGKDNSRFHPVQGYRWVTDEPAIQESRKELVERADQDNILDLQQQHLALNFKNQIDRLIVDSFVKSKLEPEKPVRTDYSQSYASRVNTPVPTSEVVVTPPPFPTKRKKSDGQTGKKKKDTANK